MASIGARKPPSAPAGAKKALELAEVCCACQTGRNVPEEYTGGPIQGTTGSIGLMGILLLAHKKLGSSVSTCRSTNTNSHGNLSSDMGEGRYSRGFSCKGLLRRLACFETR